jgi:hypothetical protein
MDTNNQNPTKINLGAASRSVPSADETVLVIVKVSEPKHVPAGFKVRARIDETMFTAECTGAALGQAEADPKVTSIALSERLRRIE